MARESPNTLPVALLFILIGTALSTDPRCGRGCPTVAQHLINHGLREFFHALGV